MEVHCLLLRLHKQLLGPPEASTSDEQHAGTIGAAVTVPAAVLEATELQHEVANVAQALSSLQAVASRLQARGQGAHRSACSCDMSVKCQRFSLVLPAFCGSSAAQLTSNNLDCSSEHLLCLG